VATDKQPNEIEHTYGMDDSMAAAHNGKSFFLPNLCELELALAAPPVSETRLCPRDVPAFANQGERHARQIRWKQ